ncbi:hypothetical protein V8N76_004508 [Salmonella enterica]
MSLSLLSEYVSTVEGGEGRPIRGDIRLPEDLHTLFDEDLVLRPMPMAWWQALSADQRAMIGHVAGLYSFPTLELVETLRGIIAGRESQTIEIGAGNGGLCRALGIRGTDNYHQEGGTLSSQYYDANGVPPVQYGDHVERIQATDAMRKFKPKVVISCWVTHKWDPRRPHLKGNMYGVDEHYILNRCDEYIFIGSGTPSHRHKPIFADLLSGRITSHEVIRVERGPHIQSRSASEGVLVHIRRKGI